MTDLIVKNDGTEPRVVGKIDDFLTAPKPPAAHPAPMPRPQPNDELPVMTKDEIVHA